MNCTMSIPPYNYTPCVSVSIPMLHKRSRINFTMDTLVYDKDEDNNYQANAPISMSQNIKKRSFS